MKEGGHEPVFIESFFITSRLSPKSSAKVERNEKKKKSSFHRLKEFETFS